MYTFSYLFDILLYYILHTPKIGAVEVGFYALSPSLAYISRLRPTDIKIGGVSGRAHIDSGAKLSVASQSLFKVLKGQNVKFITESATITLADGLRRRQQIMRTLVPVTISDRTIMTNFIVLPESQDNRTLLGVDFIQDAKMVLNLPQLLYHFLDEPGKKYDLMNEDDESTAVAIMKTETPPTISKLIRMTALEPMVSPMEMTPSKATPPPEESNLEMGFGPPIKIDFATPPASPTHDSPKLKGYSPRFISSLFRDAQMAINTSEVELSPDSYNKFGSNIDIAGCQ